MELNILQPGGGSGGKLEVSEAVFAAEFNQPLVHQVVVAYQAGGRQGTRAQKNRSAVSGGGAKPYRQKGTGRARAGTRRSPLWRGGGKIFPATTRDFSQKVNRKSYRAALRSILSELARQERLVVCDDFGVSEPRTKQLLEKLDGVESGNTLLVDRQVDDNLALAARNLHRIVVLEAAEVDPASLVGFDRVVMTSDAVRAIEERLQ